MFLAAHISLVLNVLLFVFITRLKKKTTLFNYFIAYLVEVFVWTFSVLAQGYCVILGHMECIMLFENLTYVGVAFIGVQMLLISREFSSATKRARKNRLILFFVPC